MKQDVSFHLPGKTITFKDVEVPDGDTPLPPTNAAIHMLAREDGYGTPDRTFHALCGVSWPARGGGDEHKYIMEGDWQWHRHINCAACREKMEEN